MRRILAQHHSWMISEFSLEAGFQFTFTNIIISFKNISPHSGIHHFPNGIVSLEWRTGTDHRTMLLVCTDQDS